MAIDRNERTRPRRRDYGEDRERDWARSERDWTDRAGDEVRSWMGDDEAERRRMQVDRRDGGEAEPRGYRESYGTYDRGYRGEDGGYGQRRVYGPRGRSPDGYRDDSMLMVGRYGAAGVGMGLAASPYSDPRDFGLGQREYGGRVHGPSEKRGFLDRAGDEVASWFGNDEAARRREMDEGHRGRGPRHYVRSDERMREDVSDGLTDDRHIDASDIEVSVSGGEVTLDGTVDARFAKRHAEDIAETVSGVKHVQNNLRVKDQRSGDSGPRAKPSATTGAGSSGNSRD